MNILYGVPGEGMGHATRAKVIVQHLMKTHEVRIVSSDRAYTFLKKEFPAQTHEIKGFNFAFKDGVVSTSRTTAKILKEAPKNSAVNFKKYKDLYADFKADLVISDFESFAYYYAKFHKTPIISIDNMQIINRGLLEVKIPTSEKVNYKVAKAVVKAKLPKCNQYLISTFFEIALRKKRSSLIPPIIRAEILAVESEIKDHIVVYQSSYDKHSILDVLQQLPEEQFFLYGFNIEETHGNVQFKKFSETEFIEYFRSAKAVFANGGYSFISEALCLQKPICSVPIQNQFEQYLNGAYLQKLGYGKLLEEFTVDGIKAFLYDLPKYQKRVQDYEQKDNALVFERLDAAIQEVCRTGDRPMLLR